MNFIEKEHFHGSSGTQQKIRSAQVVFKHCDIEWPKWRHDYRVQLGQWGLLAVMESTGWFSIVDKNTPRKRLKVIEPTESFKDIRNDLIKQAEMFSGIPWPMLTEPNDWSNEKLGGYYYNALMKGCLLYTSPTPRD